MCLLIVAVAAITAFLVKANSDDEQAQGQASSATSQPAPQTSVEQRETTTTQEPADTTTTAAATTTTASQETGLVERDALGTSVLVPDGWEQVDEVPGGSSSFVTFSDPNSDSMIKVSLNGCTGCVDQGLTTSGVANGVPYPEAYIPEDVTSQSKLSDTVIAYSRPTAIPGYSTDGIIRVTTFEGSPEGATVIEVTLPESQRAVATEILNHL